MKRRALSASQAVLLLGLVTAVVSAAAFFVSALGFVAAALALVTTVWGYRVSRTVRVEIHHDQWAKHGVDYRYQIPATKVRERSDVTVALIHQDGGEEHVDADVVRTGTGEIEIRSGTPEHFAVYLR